MKAEIEDWTLVIAGSWNRRIFTPNWMVENLGFPGEMQIEVKFESPTREMLFQVGPFRFSPQSQRIVFAFSQVTPEAVDHAKNIACRILTLLPHTPLAGIGWNLFYLAKEPTIQMTDALSAKDSNSLSDHGYEISSCNIRRTLICPGVLKENNVRLNLSLSQGERGSITSHFHFHRDCRTSEDAIAFLNGCHFSEAVSTAEHIISNVYGDKTDNPIRL